MTNRNTTAVEISIAAVLGLIVIVVPAALDPMTRQIDAAFLPVVGSAIEGMKPYSLLLLFLLGAGLGYFARSSFSLVGFATVALLPVWSLIDAVMGGSHNLLPIEWLFYGVFGLFAVFGAFLGSRFAPKPAVKA